MDYVQWLEERRGSFGSSDVGALMGLSSYKTPAEVVLSKIQPANPDEEMTPEQRRGLTLEPIARKLLADAVGANIKPPSGELEIVRHESAPLHCSTDGFVEIEPDGILHHPVEIKCPRSFIIARWKQQGLPPHIIVQCQVAMLCLGSTKLLFGAMDVDNWAMLHWWIDADPELQEQIIATARKFWEYVEAKTLPPEEEAAPVEEIEGEKPEDIIKAGREWDVALSNLREAVAMFDAAKAIKEQRIAEFKQAMAGHKSLYHRMGTIHDSPTKGRLSLQEKQAKAEYERLAALAPEGTKVVPWAEFKKRGKPGRTFTMYWRET